MTERRECPECGGTLPPEAPAGACPRCLLAVGLEAGDPAEETAPAPRPRHVVPGIEEMQKHFPALELLEPIGQGGMGIVYKARQRALDRLVALKVLWPELGSDKTFAERFTREARALARLDHPNIVRVYESGEVDGFYYLVMEFVEGANLRSVLDGATCQPREALAIVPQLCDALQYAHDQGVVHRDIKPANVLVQQDGRVKIADFGLAKLLVGHEDDHTLTRDGQVMGTLHYMAPEQYKTPNDVDHRADIYSLGVVFYEMLTGEVPIGRFQAPSKKVEIDVRLDGVVLRALERERDQRYQRVSDVKTEVSHITTTDGPPPGPEAVAEGGNGQGFQKTFEWSSDKRDPAAPTCRVGVAALVLVLLCIASTALALTPIDARVPIALAAGTGLAAMVVGVVSLFRIALGEGKLKGFPQAFSGLVVPPVIGCCGLVLLPLMFRHELADHPPIYIGEDGVEFGDIRITEDGVEVGPISIREDGVRIPGKGRIEVDGLATSSALEEIKSEWEDLCAALREGPLEPDAADRFVAVIDHDRLHELARPESFAKFHTGRRRRDLGVPFLLVEPGDVPVHRHEISGMFAGATRRATVVAECRTVTSVSRIEFDMVRESDGWRFRMTPVEYEPAKDE